MRQPAFPAMASHFGVEEATIQLVVSVFMVGYALPQLLIGSLADRFGRRRVLLAGLAVYFVGSLVCLLAPSLTMLLVGRFIQGLGCATGPILSRAVLRDLFSGAQLARMMSYAMIVFSSAPLLAPAIGALMLRLWTWESTFVFLLGVAVVLTLMVLYVLPETLQEPDHDAFKLRSVWNNVRAILADPRSGWSVAFLTFIYGGLMAYLLASPSLYIGYFGLGPEGFAVVFALVATTNDATARHQMSPPSTPPTASATTSSPSPNCPAKKPSTPAPSPRSSTSSATRAPSTSRRSRRWPMPPRSASS